MKISKFEIVDRCLFWEEKKTLIVGDLHLGYENSMNERGVAIPKTQMKDTFEILKKIFEKTEKVEKIILLGDVKHYFGKVLKGESEELTNLIYFFREHLMKNGEIIITKGNHDISLESVSKNYPDLKLLDYYSFEEFLFFHGDKKSFKNLDKNKEKVFVIGHLHPAVEITDGITKEKYKCFVETKWKNKELIIVPSFFTLVEGSDIFGHDQLNKKNLEESNFYVIGDFDRVYKMKGKSLVLVR